MAKELSLGGGMPANDLNGWIPLVKKLIDAPSEQRIAVVIYDVSSLKVKVDDGVTMPIVRLRAIEPITDPEKSKQIRLVMSDIYAERTGKAELDLDYDSSYDED